MSVLEVLRDIESRGLSITTAGPDLKLEGPRERMDPELVGRIRAHKSDLIAHLATASAPAPTGHAGAGFPLTPLQASYLHGRGDIFEMGNVASHVYHEIEGVWDPDRLETALRSVVSRHDALRCRFTTDGRQIPDVSAADVRVGRLDLRGYSPGMQRQLRLALREERSHRILRADRGPLVAADVVILADDNMVLQVSHDGLVMDGISMFLFFRDWWSAYRGVAEDRPDQAPFEDYLSYLDHARGQAPARRSRDHWTARLDDLAPYPDLPLRTSPSSITRPRFSQRSVRLDATQWATLKEHAARAGLTPSGLLLASYAETLSCWGAGARFTVNTTVANRPPIHPHILDAIGNFSDTMLVEVAVERSVSFAERARALHAQLRRDLDNRHFSGIDVLRELARVRDAALTARAPFTFNSAMGYALPGVDGSTLELFGSEVYTVSQTPQVWLNAFAMEQHGGVVVQLDGVDELFPDGLLDALAEGYHKLLLTLLDEAAWAETTFDLLPSEQRRRRTEANDTATPLPDRQLHEPIVEQAQRTPDAPALITATATMTYGELLRRASHAAAWLRSRAVARDELVGLVMTRGPEQIIGILATVIAGGGYLPVDAALPEQRQRYMLRDGQVRCVLTNSGWQDSDADGISVLAVDAAAPPPAETVDVPAIPGATPDDLAYVLYTSGTTGQPKGVMISHRSVANVVADCRARFSISDRDRFFAISAFNFDLSVWDVFGALSAGAALVLPDADRAVDPTHWLRLCGTAGVTVWNSVPSIVSLLHDQAVADGADQLSTLRLVMMSGDRIPPTLPAALRELKHDLRVVSLGGPTETTIWNILHPIGTDDHASRSIPYGRPNSNNRAYVLDRDGLDAPDWVTGEICAAGVGLARGYRADPERTAERFYHDQRRDERLYRTGDLGRYLPDGSIEILGRGDYQIKINGYRIEAGEVETRLAALDAIRQAVVVRHEGARGDRLVGHLVPSGPARPSTAELRDELRRHLPDYMIPSAVVWQDSLPLTRNGKVDRAKLTMLAPADRGGAEATVATAEVATDAPVSDIERAVAGLWASVLKLSEVDVKADFVDLGGDSLAAARVLTAIRKQYKVAIPLDRMSELATVQAMAAYLSAAQAGQVERADAR